ncbi:phosphoglycerate dehydrogenase [Antarcticirhabdus aurantiaca]|uniref:phosphoglycerate dehydrogenase n=1 Tax=Antarcticirhabdus aurantiaca TaxID=2606717 RepID=UPI00131BC5AA|nr:phosphoglycerate dehydrogenase [Antarcticirhabdus aurantiaca]
MTAKPRRIVITTPTFDAGAHALIREAGFEAVHRAAPSDGTLPDGDVTELLRDAEGWIVGQSHVTSDVLERFPRIKVVSRRGVGHDRVDLAAARRAGVVVTIAAGGNDASVADHAVALMLAVLRRLRETQSEMERGVWRILTSHDLYRKTVGIVGLGRVGRSVVKRLAGFECRVLVYTRTPPSSGAGADNALTFVDLATLLRESDVVSVHTPLTDATEFMIDASAIGSMKPSSILVNVGRGGVVNDRDLLEALRGGRIAGAGLDVFASESLPGFADVTKELVSLPNVVASPHAAASSAESLARTDMLAAAAAVAVLNGSGLPAEQVVADGRRP